MTEPITLAAALTLRLAARWAITDTAETMWADIAERTRQDEEDEEA